MNQLAKSRSVGEALHETHLPEAHLTEAQLDDVLIGDVLVGAEAQLVQHHLDCCPACAARVAELQAAVNEFCSVSLAWSERESSVLPLRPPVTETGLEPATTSAKSFVERLGACFFAQQSWRSSWRSGRMAASALTVGLAFTLGLHGWTTHRVTTRPAASTPAELAQREAEEHELQVARDNEVLESIDRDLSASAASPIAFGLQPADTLSPTNGQKPDHN